MKSLVEINIPSTLNEDIIEFPELSEKIYVRAKVWRLAGIHGEIIMSTSPIDKERQSIKGEDVIFYTTDIYYKKRGVDTLIVYMDTNSIAKLPNDLKTPINVIPVGLKNNSEIQDFKKNFKKYGLEKNSIYNE